MSRQSFAIMAKIAESGRVPHGRDGRRYGVDDLHDALAALWAARRIRAGTARTLPNEPPLDARGLRMAIVG